MCFLMVLFQGCPFFFFGGGGVFFRIRFKFIGFLMFVWGFGSFRGVVWVFAALLEGFLEIYQGCVCCWF